MTGDLNPLDMGMDRNKYWHSPVFFHCRGPPASCKDLVLYSHGRHPPETVQTDKASIINVAYIMMIIIILNI